MSDEMVNFCGFRCATTSPINRFYKLRFLHLYIRNDLLCVNWDVNDIKPSGVASYGALGHVPPRLPTISLVVPFNVNLTAITIQILCSV